MFEQTFKNIDDILHKDAGCTSELDYTEQSSWLLFLKYLDALEADTIIADALGERMMRTVVDVKRRELHRFARVVTEWEWTEYADHV